jgi:hypothetical protein
MVLSKLLFCHMTIKKYLYPVIICLIISISANSQPYIKGTIIEKTTKLPIAFASVAYQKQSSQAGVISDIYGSFEILDPQIKNITVTCVGYKRNKILVSPDLNMSNFIVEMEADTLNIHEVIITQSNNPAIRIIRNVLRNKEKNNFENYEKYRYQCYIKAIYDLKLSNNATAADSAAIRKNKLLNKRALFISESVASCSRINNRTDNKIIATKTSGFENPLTGLSFFSSFHNSISFYNNNISLFSIPVTNDKTIEEYLSPFSDDCLRSYNFRLEENFESTTDTIFVINFYPKKDTKFNGLKGNVYISSNGYAIKNIVAGPSEKGLIDFKFRQDYEYINERWFPTKLDEEIGFVSMHINRNINAYPVYLVTSKTDNVDFNPSISYDSINNESVYLDMISIQNSDQILKMVRSDSLKIREKNTYLFMDSIGKKHNFDYWAELTPKLMAGKIPMSFFDLDISKVYNYNKYEGTRLGIGLYTNEKLSEFISLGGFIGYGFKDSELKYGGQLVLDINKYKEIQLEFSYQNNLKEPGLDLNDNYTKLSFSEYFRNYIAYRMDNFIEEKAELNFRLFRHAYMSTALSIKEMRPTYEYQYKGSLLTNYHADDIQISFKYAFGEELAAIGTQRIINKRGNPIVSITYKRGTNLFTKQSYIYNRIESTIDLIAYKGKIGQSNIRLAGGSIDRSVPYSLLFTSEGSKNNSFPLVMNNTFQTMMPYEFLSDKYLNLFYSHNFGSLLFKTPKFKPQFVIVQNSGWGTLKNASYQGIDFKEKNKGYFESGLIINNILKLKYVNAFYIGFGMGTFYRYGYYSFSKTRDNFAFKLSVSISLK